MTASVVPTEVALDDYSQPRLQWLIRLRWLALLGILLATVVAAFGTVPGASIPLLGAVVVGGGLYNLYLWVRYREPGPVGRRAAMRQVAVDMLLLTVSLMAVGGIDSPFLSFYVFHVAVAGILGGLRATVFATAIALVCASLLFALALVPGLRVSEWNPIDPFGTIAFVVAFVAEVCAVAYLVTHAALELRAREADLLVSRAREALEYALLRNTLDELDAGLQVLAEDGSVLWKNRRVEALDFDDIDETANTLERAVENDGAQREQLAVRVGGQERVFERIRFPLQMESDGAGDSKRSQVPSTMELYLDRTQATLHDGRLVLAERLMSLGRIAQGVAHELNTPLATIRTLAADMRAALGEQAANMPPDTHKDLEESARVIQEETKRLGGITQSLLAGGDLVRNRAPGNVPLRAVVERACVLVFSGRAAQVDVQVAPEVSSANVRADPDRLLQVLVNLLQNALDAVSHEESGTVKVDANQLQDETVLVVEDNGPGLSPEIRERLFQPFATSKDAGTGLGLYTSYMLAREMKGVLRVTDAEAGGVRAELRLPSSAPEK